MGSGYVYVLTNRALAGLVKVGRTDRNPAGRAAELSRATGVVAPFELVYYRQVVDSVLFEKNVHAALEALGVREVSNREFFRIGVPEVIDIILKTSDVIDDNNQDIDKHNFIALESRRLFDIAVQYEDGEGDFFQDEELALYYYQKASELGNVDAKIRLIPDLFLELLEQNCNGKIDGKSRAKFIKECECVSDAASPVGMRYLAEFFRVEGHVENSFKAYDKMFKLIDINNDYSDVEKHQAAHCIFSYLKILPIQYGLFRISSYIDDRQFDWLAPFVSKFEKDIVFAINYLMPGSANREVRMKQKALLKFVQDCVQSQGP